jgi:hypothetical protein
MIPETPKDSPINLTSSQMYFRNADKLRKEILEDMRLDNIFFRYVAPRYSSYYRTIC